MDQKRVRGDKVQIWANDRDCHVGMGVKSDWKSG